MSDWKFPNLTSREEYDRAMVHVWNGVICSLGAERRRRQSILDDMIAEQKARFPLPTYRIEYLQADDGSYTPSGVHVGLARSVAENRLARSGKSGRIIQDGTR